MNGLDRYIRKHGKHFTEELAFKVSGCKWSGRQIEKSAQKKVYYNVTGSTIGDMVYLMTLGDDDIPYSEKIDTMLSWVGDYSKSGGPFSIWLTLLIVSEQDFDFTPYI